MNATLLTAFSAAGSLAIGASPATAAVVTGVTFGVLAVPVLATTVVLAHHALRGTDPGPAARHLITLVRILWSRPRR